MIVFQSLYLFVRDTCNLGPHFDSQWEPASWPDSQWEARQPDWTPGRRTLGKGESLFALKMLRKIYFRNLKAINREKITFLQYFVIIVIILRSLITWLCTCFKPWVFPDFSIKILTKKKYRKRINQRLFIAFLYTATLITWHRQDATCISPILVFLLWHAPVESCLGVYDEWSSVGVG